MTKRTLYYSIILLVVALSLGLRLYAVQRLYVDFDEPVYMKDAIAYADFIRTGQFKMLAWYERTYEHPPLNKILYALALLTQPPLDKLPDGDLPIRSPIETAEARRWAITDRYVSVFFGVSAIAVMTFVNPLAGFFLGVSSLSVKYTSEIYMEALPLLTSLLCVLAYSRWFENLRKGLSQRNTLWLILSAIFLGLTAASKYVYCIVGVSIGTHFVIALFQKQISWRALAWLIGWGVFSIMVFFAFDPYLWPHPLERLLKTITFHNDFQNSRIVTLFNYPFWQPLVWLFDISRFYDLKPRSAFLINIDLLIFVLAVIGLPRLFMQKRLFFYWLLIGLAFLLVWTTKWPQYTLIILVPFAVAASEGVTTIWNLIVRYIIPKRGEAQLNQSEKETHGYQNR